ncbi:MAG: phage virion morphogenesis protein [Sulfurovum sp.]|nr:phage virion morphogenesis protein [Sulfurovum sp.]
MPKGKFINVEIDDARVKKAFRKLIARGKDLSPVTEEIANHLYNLTDEAFEVERAHNGTPWEWLSDATLKRKGHNKKLYDQGTLQGSLWQKSDRKGAYVGVNATANGYKYSAVHQFGTRDGKIPARPFLPFNESEEVYDDVIEDILEMIGDYLEL